MALPASSLVIREAVLQDASTLLEFNLALARETEGVRLDPDTVRRGIHQALEDSRLGRYFVAETEGTVVGQLLITYEWSDWRNGQIWWMQSVFVDPAYRRRGVFRALYEHVRVRARADSAVRALRLYVKEDNHRGQNTYRSLGMGLSGYVVYEEEWEAE
ncbi:MAG: GNAT family N-acetyltransferase [Nitrospinaceae bacterium]|nr:GNAT family N-acetyltransferase [Nitrospinaceae bacterium]NIR57757.1 GNAT family N-acetyltransferase [Nitrospinaceae bacterium]NIS88219.1 GNAT family N-acetyltransferase [Nitrospinaceae bacterium]NIT85099.1 GNAT family N-acetyltransferase [Nitrospinaceae bacterium]NIU47256.1 GNAT family N-acetyltransferase [Nitrospinaceae bacterium]